MMIKLFLLIGLAMLVRPGHALDLMRSPDTCQIERLRKEPYLLTALTRASVSRVVCWHQDVKLLNGASVLTRLIRNRTATFIDGTSTLDLSVAALAGYRLDSLVRYWENERVYLALVLSRREPATPDPVSQIWEISPNHFMAY